jgi:hypothetical protein
VAALPTLAMQRRGRIESSTNVLARLWSTAASRSRFDEFGNHHHWPGAKHSSSCTYIHRYIDVARLVRREHHLQPRPALLIVTFSCSHRGSIRALALIQFRNRSVCTHLNGRGGMRWCGRPCQPMSHWAARQAPSKNDGVGHQPPSLTVNCFPLLHLICTGCVRPGD